MSAIAALAALLLGIYACTTASSPPPNQEIDGNCNAQGSNNNVECNVLPPSPIARGSLATRADSAMESSFVFAGPLSELGAPPTYGDNDAFFHCAFWKTWIDANPRTYRHGINFLIELRGSEHELVVVKNVRAEIFRRTPMRDVVYVQCDHGGDGNDEGKLILVDTTKPVTKVADQGDLDSQFVMPPANVQLSQSGYTSAAVVVSSNKGYLYEGRVVIEGEVNGKRHLLFHGSQEQPLRWFSDPEISTSGFYDWNYRTGRWQRFADDQEFAEAIGSE